MSNIQETKSISNDVVNLSDLIADKILRQVPLKQTQVSKINGALNILKKVIGKFEYDSIKVCSTPLVVTP